MAQHPGAQSFTSYASRILSSTFTTNNNPNSNPPLFYSTQENWELGYNNTGDSAENILGESDQGSIYGHDDAISRRGRLSFDENDEPPEREESVREYPGSRLWAQGTTAIPAFSRLVSGAGARGWKAHESVHPTQNATPTPEDVYREYSDEEEERDSMDSEPPTAFLSTPGPSTSAQPLTEPLLHPKSIYVYPSQGRLGGVRPVVYKDSGWIVGYGFSVGFACVIGIKLWLESAKSPLLPTLPTLTVLLFLTVLAGFTSLLYLFFMHNSIRHLVHFTLLGGPVLLFLCGLFGFALSWGGNGSNTAIWLERWLGLMMWVSAAVLVKVGLGKRKGVERTIKVLELSTSILLSNLPLLLLSLSLSLFSTLLSLPLFLSVSLSLDHNWETVTIFVVYLWTLGIIRGIQKVTVAGVVGSWYFERKDEEEGGGRKGGLEVTKGAFARAHGPSLGTTICSAFLLTPLRTIYTFASLLRKTTVLPKAFTFLNPLLNYLNGALEMFNGWVLAYTGLTGDGFWESAKKVKTLIRGNGTKGLGENLLVKSILLISSLLYSVFAGLIAFYIASSKLPSSSSSSHETGVLAILCFVVPIWTLRLCQGIIADAADALFLAFNVDLEKKETHCHEAVEAFTEPDVDSLA